MAQPLPQKLNGRTKGLANTDIVKKEREDECAPRLSQNAPLTKNEPQIMRPKL